MVHTRVQIYNINKKDRWDSVKPSPPQILLFDIQIDIYIYKTVVNVYKYTDLLPLNM